MDLVEFLRARYAERADGAASVHELDCEPLTALRSGACTCGEPDRIRRDVESKRRVVDWIAGLENKALDGDWWNLDYMLPLQLLAAPFADHPEDRQKLEP